MLETNSTDDSNQQRASETGQSQDGTGASKDAIQDGLTRQTAQDLLSNFLRTCVAEGASDLHLSSGQPPFFRADGKLKRNESWPVLTGDDVLAISSFLAQRDLTNWSKGAIDGAITEAGGRFRFNIFRKQHETAVAIRRLEERIRSLDELGLPDSLYDLADLKDGLVIVAGPTGSGKSTTLATLIDRINRHHHAHIITIEDPIEYIHPPQNSLVNQRQIGVDSDSFNDALVASLRQDPRRDSGGRNQRARNDSYRDHGSRDGAPCVRDRSRARLHGCDRANRQRVSNRRTIWRASAVSVGPKVGDCTAFDGGRRFGGSRGSESR